MSANLTSVSWYLPSDSQDAFDLVTSQPVTPRQNTDPLRPWFTIKFTRGIDTSAYATAGTWSPYFLLTSLSHPASVNTTAFTDVTFDIPSSVLSFRPVTALVPGDRYLATLSDALPDSQGRRIDRVYSWTFTLGGSGLTAAPQALLVSPADSSVQDTLPTLTWSVPTVTLPAGSVLRYDVKVATDPDMANVVWHSRVS